MPFLDRARLRPRLPRARDRRRPGSCWSPPRCGSSGAGRSRSRSRSAGRACGSSCRASRSPCSSRCCSSSRSRWGATGAAAAMLVSTVVFCAVWSCVLLRLRAERPRSPRRRRALKILVVSGIWPPDVGGPASHAPEVAAFLRARGHEVEAVITAAARPRREALPGALGQPLAAAGRAPRGGRQAARRARAPRRCRLHDRDARALVARLAARAHARSSTKLTADPAYERARRWGSATARSSSSSARPGAATPAAAARARPRRCAGRRTSSPPRAYLRELALGWGVARRPGHAAAEPGAAAARAPPARGAAPRARDRRPDARLRRPADRAEVARRRDRGGAPGRRRAADRRRRARTGRALERARLRRASSARLPRAAGARALSRRRRRRCSRSAWENFPHTVVEALAVGTPVIATRTRRRRRGRARRRERARRRAGRRGCARRRRSSASSPRPGLARALRAAAAPSVADYAAGRVYGRLEQILVAAAR